LLLEDDVQQRPKAGPTRPQRRRSMPLDDGRQVWVAAGELADGRG
jgi:hypothetical protein